MSSSSCLGFGGRVGGAGRACAVSSVRMQIVDASEDADSRQCRGMSWVAGSEAVAGIFERQTGGC